MHKLSFFAFAFLMLQHSIQIDFEVLLNAKKRLQVLLLKKEMQTKRRRGETDTPQIKNIVAKFPQICSKSENGQCSCGK